MAIFLANIALQHYVSHTLSRFGEAIGSFEDIALFTDWAVVREAAVSTACGTVVEGVESAIKGDGIVVESLLVHINWFNYGSKGVLIWGGVGIIVFCENIGCLSIIAIGKGLEIIRNVDLSNLGLICFQSLLKFKLLSIVLKKDNFVWFSTISKMWGSYNDSKDIIWFIYGLNGRIFPVL